MVDTEEREQPPGLVVTQSRAVEVSRDGPAQPHCLADEVTAPVGRRTRRDLHGGHLGGLGGVEAVMSAGLTAIGIPAHEAIPAVLIFRLATFWLPIPAGWVSYLMLQRRGTL